MKADPLGITCPKSLARSSTEMCEPVSMTTLLAAGLAMSTATAAAGVVGQKQQFDTNAASALQAMKIQNTQTNLGIQQKEAASGVQAQQAQTDMLKAAATAAASAGESGTSGNSVDALIGDYHATEGRYMNDLATQGVWDRAQADVSKQGQQAQAQARVNSVAKPDFLGAALRIGGDTLTNYTTLYGKDATR
jgi:hypothetical protein